MHKLEFGCVSLLLFTLQVSLLTDNGSTKDDLKLPTDETLLTQVTFSSHACLNQLFIVKYLIGSFIWSVVCECSSSLDLKRERI